MTHLAVTSRPVVASSAPQSRAKAQVYSGSLFRLSTRDCSRYRRAIQNSSFGVLSMPLRPPTGTRGKIYRSLNGFTSIGEKQLPSGRAEMSLTVFPKRPPGGATTEPALLIRLTS